MLTSANTNLLIFLKQSRLKFTACKVDKMQYSSGFSDNMGFKTTESTDQISYGQKSAANWQYHLTSQHF